MHELFNQSSANSVKSDNDCLCQELFMISLNKVLGWFVIKTVSCLLH